MGGVFFLETKELVLESFKTCYCFLTKSMAILAGWSAGCKYLTKRHFKDSLSSIF